MPEDERWFRRNWTTTVTLLAIFLAALYLRAYFPWDLAVQGRILSGGSDAFYYERIINYNIETGRQLVFDCRLNYPICVTNPRPPLYSWTVAVTAKALSPVFGDIERAVTTVFLSSTAVWGALTIFPMYFLAKDAFGRRAALLAAFFLAILPAHLQRSPATNGDHDAMVLFFVVAGFFFFVKSLKSLNEKRWVDDWAFWTKEGRRSIRAGLHVFLAENRRSALYAMLAGWSLTTIALIWQGWAYAPVILLVYFLFQILVHRFRGQDPMGILFVFGIAVGLPLLVAFPWYSSMAQIQTWYDVPLYLYLAAMALGFVFTATRDYPWALVIPLVAGAGGVGLLILSLFYPAIGVAFVSGAGYFVRSKAFETIAEAQPPGLSQIILSFGVATYFLSLFGLVWMARGIPKRPTPDYLFVVVWTIAAIFMAQAAARFIFNGSPAFAMTSAWVTILVLEWLRFDEMRRKFRSLGGRFSALRRSVKVRHVLGSVFVVLFLLLPNVWSGVDAAIPFERKAEFDRQVHNLYPEFLRSPQYLQVVAGGGAFYFGAFGYSLPLEREYFPAAWRWFRTQDAGIVPVENRPAFLSWWDYGFEAVDVGAHPTVADNFLDGYHLAGSFITSQSEAEAIALLNSRLLEGDFRGNGNRFTPAVRAMLTAHGIPADTLESVYRQPEAYIETILQNPDQYGKYEEIQPYNALYIIARDVLTSKLDADALAAMNHALRRAVGASIRYFAVDSRLFPLDGENTGIFYAPAKLSDRRILDLPDGRSIPRDFFDVIAQPGNTPIQDVRETDTVTDLTLRYKDMFYNSMFYRAYVGFPPQVAGLDCTDCVPGLPSPTNQQAVNVAPMQAWNLSHFRVVYRTAYYNPFPPEEIGNHTDAWRAIEFQEAQELQGKINRGEATGVVDPTPAATIRRGIVVVKYYDGAFVNGTVTLGRVPWPNVLVTVHDEFGIPHDTALTGRDGRYSVLAPFGQVRVTFSVGTPDNRTLRGPTTLREIDLSVTDAAAMREDVDADGDGIVDWLLVRDVAIPGETLEGTLYLDLDEDGSFDATEPALPHAELTLERTDFGLRRSASAGPSGRFRVAGLYPGTYEGSVRSGGRVVGLGNVSILEGQGRSDVAVKPTSLQGGVHDPDGRPAIGATVVVRDLTNGTTYRAVTAGTNASFSLPGLLPGDFEVVASLGTFASLPSRATVGAAATFHNVTVHPASQVAVRTTLGGVPQAFVTLTFTQRSSLRLVRTVTTDAEGRATVSLPGGTWDAQGRHYRSDSLWAFVGSLTVRPGDSVPFTVGLARGAVVGGLAMQDENRTNVFSFADLVFRGPGGQHRVRTDGSGRYLTHLPQGTWTVQVAHEQFAVVSTRTITGDTTWDLTAPLGLSVEGRVLRAFLGETPEVEPVRDATLQFFDATRTFETISGGNGTFAIVLPSTGSFALRVTRPGLVPLERPANPALRWRAEGEIRLLAEDVAVSGTIRLNGTAFSSPDVIVRFLSMGPGAVEAQAILDGTGQYTAGLQPGRYLVSVDQNASAGGGARLQMRREIPLAVDLGAAGLALDLDLVLRYRVEGTVTLGGAPRSIVVRFEGPDMLDVNATDGAFVTHLAAGAYTVVANTTEGEDPFLALQRLDVQGPTSVGVALVRATAVRGMVRHEGREVAGVPLAFTRAGGGTVSGTTDDIGQYRVLLPGGTYSVSVDHRTTANAGGRILHVRYAFAGTLAVVEGTRVQVLNVDLAQALDNGTVSGTVRFRGVPSAAQLTFLPRGERGINATASTTTGSYALSIQPGAYDVYIVAPLDDAAFLGRLDLTAGAAPTFDVALRPAVRATGVTLVRGARAPADLSFLAAEGTTALRSDGSGAYSVQLPLGAYAVEATAVDIERGISVSYRAAANVTLDAPSVLNLNLAKVVQRGVRLTWNASQRTEVQPGGAVGYAVALRNTGNEDDTFRLVATGPDFAFRFSEDRVLLPFGSGNERALPLAITANPDARVDHPPITVTARSEADETVSETVTLHLDVARYRGLAAVVSSDPPTWDGRFLNYTLEVRNKGNGPETFRATLPNEDELRASGWRAALVGPTGTPGPSVVVPVGSNATARPVLRLEKVGGSGGTLALVRVVNDADATFEALITVRVQMPALAVVGDVRVIGPGITLQAPGLDLATLAFLISVAAVVAAAVYLTLLRRRSR